MWLMIVNAKVTITALHKQIQIFCFCTLCRFFSLGGRLSRIIFMALRGGSLKYGGSPSTISMTMTPRDQISTWAQQDEVVNKKKSLLIFTCWITTKIWLKTMCYLWSVRQSRYELWCHPVWCSNQRLPSLYFLWHLGTETKVWQLHLETEWGRQKEITRKLSGAGKSDYFSQKVHNIVCFTSHLCI